MTRPAALLLLLVGCAPKAPRIPGPLAVVGRAPLPPPTLQEWVEPPAPEPRRRRDDPYGEAVADAARHWLDHSPRGFRDDCSGFVMAVLDRVGTPLSGSTATFWELAEAQGATHRRKVPAPGDLAFFDDTYDRNRNGRNDDPLSHVAVVLSVEDDGTIRLAHGGTSRGRTTLTMNLHRPHDRTDDQGRVINDWLRAERASDPPGTKHLAGELWRGFATLRPDGIAETAQGS